MPKLPGGGNLCGERGCQHAEDQSHLQSANTHQTLPRNVLPSNRRSRCSGEWEILKPTFFLFSENTILKEINKAVNAHCMEEGWRVSLSLAFLLARSPFFFLFSCQQADNRGSKKIRV